MYRLISSTKLRNCNRFFIIKNEWYRTESTQSSKHSHSQQSGSRDETPGIFTDFHENQIFEKTQKKLIPKLPLAKEFFLGKVDKELISYPEVIERDDITNLYEEIQGIKNYFENTLDVTNINKTWCIPKTTFGDLKNLGCFNYNIPKNYGKNYTISESLIASESETISPDISSILISHRVIADIINEYGTENQKQKYLPKLADGSLIATSAIYESTMVENQLFNTIAELDEITNEWTLSGEKTNVINGNEANLFLVIAQTKKLMINGEQGIGITLFLVDGTLPGIKKNKVTQPLGLRGSDIYNLSFEKVILSQECVIGEAGDGNTPAQAFLKFNRLRSSLQIFDLMKQIIRYMADFCINNKQFGVSLQDVEVNSKRLSEAVYSAYAVESMIYYTAGLMDEFDKPDVDVECAITKLFALEKLWSIMKSSLEFLGPSSLHSGEIPEIILRNTAQLYTFGESIDSLYSFIGLSGLQYAGLNMYEVIKKQRNPLFHPEHILGKLFEKSNIENPKTNLNLEHDLHPSLLQAAKWLEISIERLKISTDLTLTRYGTDIIQKQNDIQRLAKMVVLIYSMFTSLSRSSRSYCIGLQYSDYEMLLATSLSLQNRDIIKNLAKDIETGEFINNDKNHKRLSKQIFKSRGYFSEHPLKYNF